MMISALPRAVLTPVWADPRCSTSVEPEAHHSKRIVSVELVRGVGWCSLPVTRVRGRSAKFLPLATAAERQFPNLKPSKQRAL